jgi:uncharacterized membrane protein
MNQKNWQLKSVAHVWHRHPAVRTGDELTVGERAADRMRNVMGSWGFVFGALLFLAGWMLGNRGSGFDPYPFILLNLLLSCVAALQGAILLIAAKRADQNSAELSLNDNQTNQRAMEMISEIHGVVGRSSPIDGGTDGGLQA